MLKPIMIVNIKDYAGCFDSDKEILNKKTKKWERRLVQEFSFTTRNPKKTWKDNIEATVRLPKKGDTANAHGQNGFKDSRVMDYTDDGFTLIGKNMAEGVIYGWWTSGIVFNAVKKKGVISITPTKKGVR